MPNSNPPASAQSIEAKFLSGKVVKWTLPALQLPLTPEAPVVKRLLLAQGELVQIHDSEEAARYISCLELLPGTVRGNHYHKFKRESVYLMRGELSLVVRDVDSGARDTVSLRAGELVRIDVRVAHAMVVVAPGFCGGIRARSLQRRRYSPLPLRRRLNKPPCGNFTGMSRECHVADRDLPGELGPT
jgi:hypothetical protein